MKSISIKMDQQLLDWLTDQVKNYRFASIAHGVRQCVREAMNKEKEES